MKTARTLSLTLALFIGALAISARVAPTSTPKEGAIRVLFLGHESEHHNSNKFYPMLAKGLGGDAIYFDYVTNVEEALGDAAYLSKRAVDLATMPIYVRAGAIVPIDPIRQYTGQKVDEPTTLKIYRGANGNYTLYDDDDGTSLDYLEGDSAQTLIKWDDASKTLSLEPASKQTATRAFQVELMPNGKTKAIQYDGRPLELKF